MTSIKTRDQLLDDITQGLANNTITSNDLEQFIITPSLAYVAPAPEQDTATQPTATTRLSAVEVLFYIAGIILFAGLVAIILQTPSENNLAGRLLLSGGVGFALWVVAFLLTQQEQTAIIKGLTNAILLTGSLSLLLAGFIITSEFTTGYSDAPFSLFAIILLCVGLLHIGFDWLVKHSLTLLFGILLSVAALPFFLFAMLQDIDAPVDAWSLVVICAAGLLALITRILARFYADRPKIDRSFDSLAVFVGLLAMYVASFGDNSGLWLFLLIGAVIGLFYVSIIQREKPLLGSASVFLVIAIITIAFRYFSNFGIGFCLFIAAGGILGTAAIASVINKKYFATTTIPPQVS